MEGLEQLWLHLLSTQFPKDYTSRPSVAANAAGNEEGSMQSIALSSTRLMHSGGAERDMRIELPVQRRKRERFTDAGIQRIPYLAKHA